MDKRPIAFRTNRHGKVYPLTSGTPDRAKPLGKKRPRVDGLQRFDPALIMAGVVVVRCRLVDREIYSVALDGGKLLLESVAWEWRRHVCECASPNDFGFGYVLGVARRAIETTGLRPMLAVIGASSRVTGSNLSQYAAVVEIAAQPVKRCLRLRLAGVTDADIVQPGTRLQAGTLLVMGINGSVKKCYSTNTFEYECVDDQVSPMELDLPQTWIPGSGIKI